MWSTCSPDKSKFQRDFDDKLDKGSDVAYNSTTTDTERENSIPDYWRKVLSQNISNIGLDGILRVEVYSKEVFFVDEYATFTYDICLAIGEKRFDDDFYSYYDTLNNQFSYLLISNVLYDSTINIIDKYSPDIDDNGFLLFLALTENEVPEIEAAYQMLGTEFKNMKFIEYYSKDTVDEYLNNFKKKLVKSKYTSKDLIPTNAPETIVYQMGCAIVNRFTTDVFASLHTTVQDTVAFLEITRNGLKTTKSYNFTWREVFK